MNIFVLKTCKCKKICFSNNLDFLHKQLIFASLLIVPFYIWEVFNLGPLFFFFSKEIQRNGND